MSEGVDGMGQPCPPLLCFGFVRSWFLHAKEDSWDQPPLAKSPVPELCKDLQSSAGTLDKLLCLKDAMVVIMVGAGDLSLKS